MINIYKQPESANTYANLFIQEIPDKVKNVCLLFIGHLETIYNILVAKPDVNFTVIDGSDTTEALPYIYNGANLKESITFKDGWCKDNDTFIEGLHSIFNNMPFDLIIANPPFEVGGSVLEKTISCAEKLVFLMPAAKYAKSKLFEYVEDIKVLSENPFADASVDRLCVTKCSCSKVYKYKTLQELKLTGSKHKLLWRYVLSTNVPKHEKLFRSGPESLLLDSLSILLPSRGVYASSKTTDCYRFNRLGDKSDIICKLRKNNERVCIEGTNTNCTNIYVVIAKDSKSRNAFLDFVESDYFQELAADFMQLQSGFPYETFLYFCEQNPVLDWSKSWTDQEILKEIGLSEDFLEKE